MFCVKQVLCIGPTGTGKTLTMSDKLLKNMPAEYITHFLMFSARTSANQTQDFIDSKLDKRCCPLLDTLSLGVFIHESYLWAVSITSLTLNSKPRLAVSDGR